MDTAEFKFVKIQEGANFDEKEMALLKAIDDALMGHKEGSVKLADVRKEIDSKMEEVKKNENYELMQKQLDAIFVKLETSKPAAKVDKSKKQIVLTNKWIQALIKRDKTAMGKIEAELKLDSQGNWEPGDGGTPLFADGPVTLHDAAGFDTEQGAYLVPELLLAEVARWTQEFGLARRDMRYLPFNGPGKERTIPFLLQNVVASWVDQGGVKPKSKPYYGKVTQLLEKMAVIVPMTEEVVEDTAINLIEEVGRLIAEKFAELEDATFFAGDTVAGDPFDGVINAAGTTIVDLAGTFTLEQFNPMAFPEAFPTQAIKGGKFYMHRQTLALLQAARASAVAAGDGEGVFLFQAPTALGQPYTLWGFPIEVTDVLPSYNAAASDETFAFFSNLSKTCYYGEKGGLRTKILTEASLTDNTGDKVNLAEQDMIALRAYKRVGYVPVLPDGIAVFQK
jgi:HK97 family phage major capsid protein